MLTRSVSLRIKYRLQQPDLNQNWNMSYEEILAELQNTKFNEIPFSDSRATI
jgi:hypothetical protein